MALAVALDLILLSTLAGINAGVGIYALLLIATVLGLRWLWRHREEARARWQGLAVPARELARTLLLPLWICPIRSTQDRPAFLRNRKPAAAFLDDRPSYYPDLLEQLAPGRTLGITVSARPGRADLCRPHRDLAGACRWPPWLIGLLLATFHPPREPRFFPTVAPFFLLLAAIAACFRLRARGCPSPSAGHRGGLGTLLVAGAAAGLSAPGRRSGNARAPPPTTPHPPAEPRAPSGFAGQEGASGSPSSQFNELSDFIRWSLVQSQAGNPEVASRSPASAGLSPEKVRERLGRWIAEEEPGARPSASPPTPASPARLPDLQRLAARRHSPSDPRLTLSRDAASPHRVPRPSSSGGGSAGLLAISHRRRGMVNLHMSLSSTARTRGRPPKIEPVGRRSCE
jgi:hypothetical protein